MYYCEHCNYWFKGDTTVVRCPLCNKEMKLFKILVR